MSDGRLARTVQKSRVIAVVGPTATGKSELAELLAEGLGGEVVSADSMQVYRGMDIGTAKVPAARRRVPYHCIDLVDPGTPYSAAVYQRDARNAIDAILSGGKAAILCGGTGLYVRAALDEMSFPAGEQDHNPIRERYQALADKVGGDALHALLAKRDPESAALIHPHNVRRTIRALELLDGGETTYARQHAGLARLEEHYHACYLGLTMPRGCLYRRIDERVSRMVEAGLADEIRTLASRGFLDALTAPQAIGYKELAGPVLAGQGPGDEEFEAGAEQIRTATRRYAKRQMTWFRKDSRIAWLPREGADGREIAHMAEGLLG